MAKPDPKDNRYSKKTPGTHQASWAISESIAKVFVQQRRGFMNEFWENYQLPSGCRLNADLCDSVRQALLGKLQAWSKTKYHWNTRKHPEVLRMFPGPNKAEPFIQIDPGGKYNVKPAKCFIEARSIRMFCQTETGEIVVEKKRAARREQEKKRWKESPPNINIPRSGNDKKSCTGKINRIEASIFYRDEKFVLDMPLNKDVHVPPDGKGLKRTFGGVSLFVNSYHELVCEVVWKIEGESLDKDRPPQKHLKSIPAELRTNHTSDDSDEQNKVNLFESNNKEISFYPTHSHRNIPDDEPTTEVDAMDVDVDSAEAMEIVNEETDMMEIDGANAEESLAEAESQKKPRLTLRQLREQYAVGRVVNRLEDSLQMDSLGSLGNKDEGEILEYLFPLPRVSSVSGWFESNLPHINAEVERARAIYLKKFKQQIVKQPFDAETLQATLPETPEAKSMVAEFKQGRCCFGRDVQVLPAGRGSQRVDGGILVYDPGVVHPVTAANEKGDLFFFGNKFSRFLRYARGKISKYQSEIDKLLDQDPEVVKLRDQIARIDDDRKNHHGPFDPGIFQKDEKEKVKLLAEIGLLKVALQGKSAETRELHEHILRLRAEMKARSVRFMDEFSNFCCAFRTIVAPAFNTPSVSSTKRKHQLDTESKDLLKYINHESLLKLIKQKVEARGGVVIVTSEAFTTKTCSGCGHHRTVGRARIYSCTKCKAVKDRDGNAAMNILRDTLLRIIELQSKDEKSQSKVEKSANVGNDNPNAKN
ncbi:hypothetical protein HDU96_003474 [Phlyctochytrium bullatum]|nr:hypothetical protein HDU96_003474 [Phlyctochytrium bullatum]